MRSRVDEQRDDRPASSGPVPSIELPRGGGAIRGMGEKFAANPVTGTGSLTVPLPTSRGRSGFGPQLALSYDSGSGNGPFGFGWSLSLPAITRKTDKGLPTYDDATESDVYILSGTEDLVPALDAAGQRHVDDESAPGFVIHRYRPRVEGLFARIERWTNRATGELHWRSITRDNVTTLYGRDNGSRVFDPADPNPLCPSRVFSWLICASYDDKGNAIVYEYAAENSARVDRTLTNERNRTRPAQRYLKRIKYGNRESRLVQPDLTAARWLFEVVLDYDEGHYEELGPDPDRPAAEQRKLVRAAPWPGAEWAVRPDPFSSHRAGFEVRSYRRCRRLLMFHRFAELNERAPPGLDDEPYLVRAIEFDYADLDYSQTPLIDVELAHQGSTRFASFIRSIAQLGFVRDDAQAVVERGGVQYATYAAKSMPALEIEYARPVVRDEIAELDPDSLANLPIGVDGGAYEWVDLDGEGVSGILSRQASAWLYKPNLGGGRFGAAQALAATPSLFASPSAASQLFDLSGDGELDVVALAGPTPGFYERARNEWQTFRAFPHWPNLRWDEPNLRFIDLDGDGCADVLITENDAFAWHESLAEDGFGPARRVARARDEEKGPCLVFADGAELVYLADMCGDGLTDLVRIRNGEICYWPNLGYGRFGAKVTMDDPPWFDHQDQFDRRRIRLVDIDGSGTTDIVYLARDGVRLYFNQAGNRWSAPRRLAHFPRVDDLSAVMTADVLGNGTACLVWSSPLPADGRRALRYVNLLGGRKPHLLVKVANNLGLETHVEYASSTKFYLADKQDGKPWIARLPFPVHVVERTIAHDRVSGNRFVTQYRYHHGHFDGVEREFRGFGMVEQLDTEDLPGVAGTIPPATNVDAASHVPPVLTKTWFHTGLYLGRDRVSDFFAGLLDDDVGEYYREPGLTDEQAEALLLPDTPLPAGLTVDEEREACRALKGMMLRREVYALDASAKQEIPYTVTEQNFTIEELQPHGTNPYAVFFAHSREVLDYHYERDSGDPRISHALTLEVNAFGNVMRSLSVAYGRRVDSTDPVLTPTDKAKQADLLITYTHNRYTENAVGAAAQADLHRAPLLAEARTYELTGFAPRNGARFDFDEWTRDGFALLGLAADLAYEQTADRVRKNRRLIEHVRTLYRKDDLTGFSPLGKVESRALPGETYKLALTPGLIAKVFRRSRLGQADEELVPSPAGLLEGKGADRGGYVAWDGSWWIPSGRAFFDAGANSANPAVTAALELSTACEHFFVPRSVVDAFGQAVVVEYDAFDLLTTSTKDPLGNVVRATNDYRVLQPRLVTDPNRNRTAIEFDALGMVVATAVMGKTGELVGDSLAGFDADPVAADLLAFIAAPDARAPALLGGATARVVYDLTRYARTGQPVFAATLARDTHFEPARDGRAQIQITFSYSDGFGREIQKKIRAEGGEAPRREAATAMPAGDVHPGALMRDAQGNVTRAHADVRWIGSGRTLFNNKGKPVRQYEPFFSATHLFEPEREMTDTGVSPILFYDPVERVIATLHPNHTYEKVVFDAWRQTTYDVNDTAEARGEQTGDPRTDPDVRGYVAACFASQPAGWQTWHAQRVGNALGAAERDAAHKTAAHAGTPTVAHLDVLGRVFATVEHNVYERNGAVVDEKCATRVTLDIEGNQRVVQDATTRAFDAAGNETVDALGRTVMRCDYDMLGNRVHQSSMDAGDRWLLADAAGRPIRAWDGRGFARRMTYDELRRLTGLYVAENGVERLAERTEYGEARGDAANHRGQAFRRFDAAGIVTSVAYDFKGNLLESKRELLPQYAAAVNWLDSPAATDGTFTTRTAFDALNRPVAITAPDGSLCRWTYNEASLLEKVDVRLRGAAAATPFVTNVDYDAKGRRERIRYGNGAQTTHEYDPLTYRLTVSRTTRPAGGGVPASQLFEAPAVVQDLRYTYDPVGNITRVENAALRTVVAGGQQVRPVFSYTYDSRYRLIAAQGREHAAQTALDLAPVNGDFRGYPFAGAVDPNDLQALRNYTERYEYDAVGNIETLLHRFDGGGWTRRYAYETASVLEPMKRTNRVTSTTLGNGFLHVEPYTHDAHGNVTSMPHLAAMTWDFDDRLTAADLGGGGTAYYVHDAGGERVRKVIESQQGTRRKERLYLGLVEIYREYGGDGNAVEVEQETLHVLDDEKRIALVQTQTVAGGARAAAPDSIARYQLADHLGSSTLELDAAGALISHEEYHPYGTTALLAGRSAAEVSLKRYRHIGKERDAETGFGAYGVRHYVPWLGIWTSCEPLLMSTSRVQPGTSVDPDALVKYSSVGAYSYAWGNPLRYVDPGGMENIAVVGSQHSTGTANKMMFAHQGIRKIREYESTERDEARTLVMFKEGYTNAQIDAVRAAVTQHGAKFILVDSIQELASYVNGTPQSTTPRSADPITNLDFFSHGVVGAVEFGYETQKAAQYRLDETSLELFAPEAFARGAVVSSFACRTGLGNSGESWDAFGHLTGQGRTTFAGNVERYYQSLAQRIANRLNVTVRAFAVRSDYSDTLGSSDDRCTSYLRLCPNSPELDAALARRKTIDGAIFDPEGAIRGVKGGVSPSGLPKGLRTYTKITAEEEKRLKEADDHRQRLIRFAMSAGM